VHLSSDFNYDENLPILQTSVCERFTIAGNELPSRAALNSQYSFSSAAGHKADSRGRTTGDLRRLAVGYAVTKAGPSWQRVDPVLQATPPRAMDTTLSPNGMIHRAANPR